MTRKKNALTRELCGHDEAPQAEHILTREFWQARGPRPPRRPGSPSLRIVPVLPPKSSD